MAEILKKRIFKIYKFDKKTRQVTGISTLRTKPMTQKRFEELIKEEMASEYYRKSCVYEVVR